ncbi:MAG: hypothetical protein QXU98_13250 [Candidatus Parvarchaeota archaeon]
MAENRLFFITFPLAALAVAAIINVAFTLGTLNLGSANVYSSGFGALGSVFNKIGLNSVFSLSIVGIIGLIVVVLLIVAVSGVSIFGSGLNSGASTNLTIYAGFLLPFLGLLALSFNVIMSIPDYIGVILLGILSLMYFIGISDRISSRGG